MANPAVTAASGFDFETASAVIGFVAAAVGVVVAGFRRGLTSVKEIKPTQDGRAQIAAGMIVEASSLNAWAEVTRESNMRLTRLIETMEDHRRHVSDNNRHLDILADEMRDVRRALDELQRRSG